MITSPFAVGTTPDKSSLWLISFRGPFLAFTFRQNPKHAGTFDVLLPEACKSRCFEADAKTIFAAISSTRIDVRISGHIHVEAVILPEFLELRDGSSLTLGTELLLSRDSASMALRQGRWVPIPAKLGVVSLPPAPVIASKTVTA